MVGDKGGGWIGSLFCARQYSRPIDRDRRRCARRAKPLQYPLREQSEASDLTGEAGRTTYGDDEELAEGIRRREPRAMELLFDRLGGQAFGLAYRILGDGPSAEDAVQEAFLTLWRQADRLNPARGRLSSYLMTLVHHRAVDLLRARKGLAARNLPLDPAVVPAEADVLESVAQSLGRDAVRRALAELSPEQREAIELAYFEGLTHVEIAEALGLPLGTVKSRLRLGLEKMRSTLRTKASR